MDARGHMDEIWNGWAKLSLIWNFDHKNETCRDEINDMEKQAIWTELITKINRNTWIWKTWWNCISEEWKSVNGNRYVDDEKYHLDEISI